MSHNQSVDFAAFQAVLRKSRNVVAVAGAGLSAASGIPTFRGAGGMWRKYDAMSLASPEAFAENPSLTWQFYHYRREKAKIAQPNAAHIALARFSLPPLRHQVAPDSTFTLITQNVDDLSSRALEEVLSESTEGPILDIAQPKILEMHGRLFEVECTSRSCQHTEFTMASPICEALAGTEAMVEEGVMDPDIPTSSLPRCSKCGALARPGVVWFGENIRYGNLINDLVGKADLCLVVGTSSTVYPAASYASRIKSKGGKVAVFNLESSPGDEDADFVFRGPCEQFLPKALGIDEPRH